MTAAQARDLAERQRRPENRAADTLVRQAIAAVGQAAGAGKSAAVIVVQAGLSDADRAEAWRRLRADGFRVKGWEDGRVQIEW